MAIPLSANGNTFNYPETGDTAWGSDATNLVSAVCAALGSIGLGASLTPEAIIDLNSTSRGFYPPRMTEAQRDAIVSPGIGLIVINTTSATFDYYDGTAWQSLKISNSPSWTENDTAPTALATEQRYAKINGQTFTGNITAPVVTGSTSVDSPIGNLTTVNSTTVNTPTVKATTSGGLALRSNSDTLIGTFGGGGGNNGTFEGGLNIKGVVGVGNGTTTLPSLHGDTDTNTGILFDTPDTLKFVTNGETRLKILPTGQLQAVYESTVGTDYNTTLHNGYLCRAWVNFNGTGTVAIRASGNVSTITDNGTGDYTVNFTTAMPDANYAASVTTGNDNSAFPIKGVVIEYLTGSVRVFGERNTSGTNIDSAFMNVGIFR